MATGRCGQCCGSKLSWKMSLPLTSQAVKWQKPSSGLRLPLHECFQSGNPNLLLCRSMLS